MKKNKMLSLAAAMILTSTAAMAFDAKVTDENNSIVTHDNIIVDGFIQANYNPNYWTTGNEVKSGYINGVQSDANLTLSDTRYGDALIYSAFKTGDGWESEISVTNTSSTDAVVAKVVLYAADDSRELIDFNIYLSANDVFKFKVDENGVSTIDDSIEKSATIAYEVTAASDADKVTMNTYGDVRQIAGKLPVTEGYAVIYAMAEAKDNGNATLIAGADANTAATYHKEHDDLFLDYRELLDACRISPDSNDTWRQALKSNDHMMNGMIRDVIQAPNVFDSCDTNTTTNYNNKVDFVNPSNNILFGQVSIMNTAGGSALDARNITLNAVALANFTDTSTADENGTMMLWTAGEMATISDRRIISDDNASNTAPDYNATGVAADAKTFEIASAHYSYSDSEMANTLHLTSPVKRPLVQLLNNGSYWSSVSSTKPYGEYDFSSTIYNDQEDKYEVATVVDSGIVVSPYNPDAAQVTDKILIESGGISNLQAEAVASDAEKFKTGYVEVNFKSNLDNKYPAIVTQMSAKSVNGNPITNWYFAPVK